MMCVCVCVCVSGPVVCLKDEQIGERVCDFAPGWDRDKARLLLVYVCLCVCVHALTIFPLKPVSRQPSAGCQHDALTVVMDVMSMRAQSCIHDSAITQLPQRQP